MGWRVYMLAAHLAAQLPLVCAASASPGPDPALSLGQEEAVGLMQTRQRSEVMSLMQTRLPPRVQLVSAAQGQPLDTRLHSWQWELRSYYSSYVDYMGSQATVWVRELHALLAMGAVALLIWALFVPSLQDQHSHLEGPSSAESQPPLICQDCTCQHDDALDEDSDEDLELEKQRLFAEAAALSQTLKLSQSAKGVRAHLVENFQNRDAYRQQVLHAVALAEDAAQVKVQAAASSTTQQMQGEEQLQTASATLSQGQLVAAARIREAVDRASSAVNQAATIVDGIDVDDVQHRAEAELERRADLVAAKMAQTTRTLRKSTRAANTIYNDLDRSTKKQLKEKTISILDIVLKALGVNMSSKEALQFLPGGGDLRQSRSSSYEENYGAEQPPSCAPVAVLLAGLIVPLQLQILATWNRWQIVMLTPLLMAAVGVMVFDLGRTCGSGSMWLFMEVLALLLAKLVLARLAIVAKASAVLRRLQFVLPTEAQPMQGDDRAKWIIEFRRRLEEGQTEHGDALVGYDAVTSSWFWMVKNFLGFGLIVWGAVGVYWSIKHVVEDDRCDAEALSRMAHAFAFVYVMLITWIVPVLLLKMLSYASRNRAVAQVLLQKAGEFDAGYSLGIPLATTLARALLLLQNVADLRSAELVAALQDDVAELQECDESDVTFGDQAPEVLKADTTSKS